MVYFFITVVSFIIVYLSTPSIRYLGLKLLALDTKNHRKIHKKKVITTFGGLAIYLGFLGGLAIIPFFDYPFFRIHIFQIMGLGVCSTLVLLLGIYDDFQGSNAQTKFFVQTIIAFLFIRVGFKLGRVFIPGVGDFSLGPLSIPLTILWLVGITNAMNLLDGVDGLAAGVAAIVSLFLTFCGILSGEKFIIFVTLALLGATAGFLKYNFHPAKIFMGDSGSLFLGCILGSLAIYDPAGGSAGNSFFLPAFVMLLLPILDTTLAIIRRIIRRQHIFRSDSCHIHHYCLKKGLTQVQTVLYLYFFTFMLGLIAVCLHPLFVAGIKSFP